MWERENDRLYKLCGLNLGYVSLLCPNYSSGQDGHNVWFLYCYFADEAIPCGTFGDAIEQVVSRANTFMIEELSNAVKLLHKATV